LWPRAAMASMPAGQSVAALAVQACDGPV
jgi:hypothetical protein